MTGCGGIRWPELTVTNPSKEPWGPSQSMVLHIGRGRAHFWSTQDQYHFLENHDRFDELWSLWWTVIRLVIVLLLILSVVIFSPYIGHLNYFIWTINYVGILCLSLVTWSKFTQNKFSQKFIDCREKEDKRGDQNP